MKLLSFQSPPVPHALFCVTCLYKLSGTQNKFKNVKLTSSKSLDSELDMGHHNWKLIKLCQRAILASPVEICYIYLSIYLFVVIVSLSIKVIVSQESKSTMWYPRVDSRATTINVINHEQLNFDPSKIMKCACYSLKRQYLLWPERKFSPRTKL